MVSKQEFLWKNGGINMVNENKLYTAYITGTSQDGNKEYERVIITKMER